MNMGLNAEGLNAAGLNARVNLNTNHFIDNEMIK